MGRRLLTGRTIGAVTVAAALALAGAPVALAANDGDDLVFDQHRIDVSEGAGRVSLTVHRATTAALEETEAAYASYDRTASQGGDFAEASGRVRLGVGQTSSTITVYLFDDGADEADESFVVRLYRTTSASEALDEVTVTIHDDDDPPIAEPTLGAAAVSAGAQPRPAAAHPTARELPQGSARPYVRPVPPSRRTARQPTKPVTPRVTPFEIRGPARPSSETLPVPDHASPRAAAALIAALALARVSAEAWYRWRVREI